MTTRLQDVLMVAAVLCAMLTTALVVRREFFPARADERLNVTRTIEDGEPLARNAPHQVGQSSAQHVVVEFFDFQCPACRRLSYSLDSLLLRHPNDVRIARHHFPLTSAHPLALSLSLHGLCISDREAFEQYYHAVFNGQEKLQPPTPADPMTFVPVGQDTARVRLCASSRETFARIERELELADSLRLRGTPSLIVGTKVYTGSRSLRQLEQLLGLEK
jgi:protein-disulfide isomerase